MDSDGRQDDEDLRRVRAAIAAAEAGAPRHVFTCLEDMMAAAGLGPEGDDDGRYPPQAHRQ